MDDAVAGFDVGFDHRGLVDEDFAVSDADLDVLSEQGLDAVQLDDVLGEIRRRLV